MARAPIYLDVHDAAGNAISGANVAITRRTGGTAATLYAAESGPTTIPNPTVSGTGITTYTVAFDAIPGDDRTIDALWLPGDTVPRVTTLPTTGLIDGMEVNYVADSATGTVWRLKYNAGSPSTYKWEFVGGPPLHNIVAASTVASATYVDLTVSGVSFTLARAGDYLIDFGVNGYLAVGGGAGAGSTQAMVSITVNGVAAVDADGFLVASYNDGVGNYTVAGNSVVRRKTVNAGGVVAMRYRTAGATNGRGSSFYERFMTITPVRLI
jgi:hypothetical protein